MTVQHRRSSLPLFATALAVFAWGFGPLFVKGIDASAPTIVFWRVLFGTVIAVAFAYPMGGRITWRLLVVAFPAGVCFGLSFIFGFTSFQETSIVNATLIPALQPVLILFAGRAHVRRASVRDRARVRGVGVRREWSSWSPARAPTARRSRATCSRCSTCWSSPPTSCWASASAPPTCTRGRCSPRCSSGRCVVVVPWSLISSHDLGAIHGTDWLLLLGLILLPGMVGHGLMTWAHHYVDVTVTSMMTLANPVVSIVGAWILYDQDLDRRAVRRRRRGARRARCDPPPPARRARARRRSRPHRRPPRRVMQGCVT